MFKKIAGYTRYLWLVTEGFHRLILGRTIIGIVRVAFLLSFIWLSKTAIDCAVGRDIPAGGSLTLWFALMVACMLVEVALSRSITYIETRATLLMNNRVNRRLFNTLMTMPTVNGRQGFHSGDMLNRLTLDVRSTVSFALSKLPSMVVMAVQLVASFLFLAWLNPYLALAPVIIMPVCVVGGKLYFRRQRRLMARARGLESDIHVAMQEGLQHRLLLKTLQSLGQTDRRLRDIQHDLDITNRRQARLSATSSVITRLGFVTGYLTAFGWSIYSLQAGIISFGTMTAFIQLVSRIQSPIASIAGYLPAFLSTSVAIDRLRDIGLTPTPAESRCVTLDHPGVRVNNLSFRYEDHSPSIFSGFSHDFTPGSRTLIVGPTGAGKTTLIKLLLGLLKPLAGSVEIYDRHRALAVSDQTLCNFVYVPQGNTLMHGTIRDNLLMANPEASDTLLAQALHNAAADFVFTLPRGLDTPCDETGGGLSEGQAQRVAIARALLRPGSILLLDEFNSALDPDTTATLMQRLATRCPDSTIIFIAHHPTLIAPHCHNVIHIR